MRKLPARRAHELTRALPTRTRAGIVFSATCSCGQEITGATTAGMISGWEIQHQIDDMLVWLDDLDRRFTERQVVAR